VKQSYDVHLNQKGFTSIKAWLAVFFGHEWWSAYDGSGCDIWLLFCLDLLSSLVVRPPMKLLGLHCRPHCFSSTSTPQYSLLQGEWGPEWWLVTMLVSSSPASWCLLPGAGAHEEGMDDLVVASDCLSVVQWIKAGDIDRSNCG
jgi:hypothetical protein